MNNILVIGGTGNIGREVVARLAAADVSLRVLARHPDRAALPPGVAAVRGDLTLPETLDQSLDGVQTVFLVWTAPPAAVPVVLERIARQARRIVFLSSPYKTPHPFFQNCQPNPSALLHAQIERLIESSELHWTFLRPGMLASNAVTWWAAQIRAGDVVRWPYLSAPTAPIDERDIAAVAVHALLEDGHAGAEYVLTGPESLSQFEQLAIVGRAIGRPLRIEEISPDEWRGELSSWPAFVLDMLLAAWAGAIGQPAYVTSTVAQVTGRPARRFSEWASDHASAF